MSEQHYTFGDTALAEERLSLLARTYEPATRALPAPMRKSGDAAVAYYSKNLPVGSIGRLFATWRAGETRGIRFFLA